MWTYAGTIVRLLCQFGIGVAIARMLGPEPYGLVAGALIVTSLARLIADGGISSALIHHRDVSSNEIAGAFWVQFGLGGIACLAIAATAPWTSALLSTPEAVPFIQVTALGFPMEAVAGTCKALLRQRLDVRAIQVASVASYVCSYAGIGLGMAWAGYGAWALVAAFLAQTAINAAVLWANVRPSWRDPVWPRRLFGFGGWTVLINITCWTHMNMVAIFAVRCFGVPTLGQYNRLTLVTEQTVPVFAGPIHQVIFPAVSRAGDDRGRRQRIIRTALRLLALVFVPAMLVMAVFPHDVVLGIFGVKFGNDTAMLTPMALATLGMAFMAVTAQVLAGVGKPRLEVLAQFATLPLAAVLLVLFSTNTVTTLCWGLCIGAWIRAAACFFVAIRSRAMTISDLIVGICPAIPPSILGLGGAWAGFAATADFTPELRLLIAAALATACWAGCIVVFWRLILPLPVSERIVALRNRLWRRRQPGADR